MSDLKISEFRERAEHGLDFPDLAVIERQGRALRRRRVATTTGALALVFLVGAGIARTATDGTDAAPAPATPPSSTPTTANPDRGVRTSVDLGEEVLLPGPSKVSYDGVTVRFDVPSKNWEWWGVGMGLRRAADNASDYGAAVFFLQDATARLQPCSADRAQPLGADPTDLFANVAPLLDLAHARVLQEPRVVTAFGGVAVHLRLQTKGTCPWSPEIPAQLRGVVNWSDADPGWGGRHVLDAWHVVLRGAEPTSVLVASWDLNGTSRHHAEQQALLDSVRIQRG